MPSTARGQWRGPLPWKRRLRPVPVLRMLRSPSHQYSCGCVHRFPSSGADQGGLWHGGCSPIESRKGAKSSLRQNPGMPLRIILLGWNVIFILRKFFSPNFDVNLLLLCGVIVFHCIDQEKYVALYPTFPSPPTSKTSLPTRGAVAVGEQARSVD